MAMRVAVVGLGFGQHVHIPAWRLNSLCDVASVCGTSYERSRVVAERVGVEKAFGDWKKAVSDPDVDIVSIAVPGSLQYAVAMEAVRCGKHVFCEKPLTLSYEDSERLFIEAEKNRCCIDVNYIYKYVDVWRSLKGHVSLMDVWRVKYEWELETYASRHHVKSWKNDVSQGGGVLHSFGTHVLHNVEWVFGKIESLCAVYDETRFLSFHMKMEHGFLTDVSLCTQSWLKRIHACVVYGGDRIVGVENTSKDHVCGFEGFSVAREDGLRTVWKEKDLCEGDGRIVPTFLRTQDFVRRATTSWHQNCLYFQDLLRVEKLVEYALVSSRENRWIKCL